ncbi:MAG: peroxidase [Candidatus Rokubacteria bacterium RIFCSPLOWO2_02_FULL_73_56]|nr:MAG: peroxidase [Candidatus Rokubacteria bacterium RIFCSPLOWO2_02_FULL_73_56]
MTRLTPIDPAAATGKAKELLSAVEAKLRFTPNMMRTMAISPAVLDGYLCFSSALGGGALGAKLREQIALAVAEANGCEYCLAAHSTIGKMVGLTNGDVVASRQGRSSDPKATAALAFARAILDRRGDVSDVDLRAVREAGHGDAEIAEIVAHVALNVFTNYFNRLARTSIDF